MVVYANDGLCAWQYELLDEIMDFGFPQFTEAKILSEFIKTDAYRMETTQRPPMAVTNAVSWRSEGIRYKKNEVGWSSFHVYYWLVNPCAGYYEAVSVFVRSFWMWWKVSTYLSTATDR